jgi:hypothetical protein
MVSRRASQRVETALYTCLRTSRHAPACWVEARRPLLRTPERRLRSVEARRGLSLSPQRARKTSLAFHSSSAACSRHRELGLDGRAVEGLSDAPRSRPLQHQPSGLKARGGGACACIAVSNYVLSAQRALSRIIISYNPCPVNTQRSAHSGVLGCAHRTRAPPPKSKRARGWHQLQQAPKRTAAPDPGSCSPVAAAPAVAAAAALAAAVARNTQQQTFPKLAMCT